MRPSINETMLEIAHVWSKRATCAKRQVGAVIVDATGHVLSSGYNGQPRGYTHCTPDSPCPAYHNADLSCVAIHAEINALIRCPDVNKAFAIYITTKPCDKCMLAIKNTAIELVFYPDGRGDYYMEKIKRIHGPSGPY
jgi:dCMP deaminase